MYLFGYFWIFIIDTINNNKNQSKYDGELNRPLKIIKHELILY